MIGVILDQYSVGLDHSKRMHPLIIKYTLIFYELALQLYYLIEIWQK